jgi:uncharacterized protein (DUF305 family)
MVVRWKQNLQTVLQIINEVRNNMIGIWRRFIATGLLVLLLSGCVGIPTVPVADQRDGAATPMGDAQMGHGDTEGEDADEAEAEAGHMDHGAMMGDPSVPFDAQFIDAMIVHHEGAVVMAEEALERAERPELRAMAEEIMAAQAPEIEQMQRWRDTWYPDLAATAGMDMPMGDMEVSADESIPYDQRFMLAMISHHEGAIAMAEAALMHAENEELMILAEAIIAAQQAEIDQMRMWLAEWFDVED